MAFPSGILVAFFFGWHCGVLEAIVLGGGILVAFFWRSGKSSKESGFR